VVISIEETAVRAKDAALRLAGLSTDMKNGALRNMANLLIECRAEILRANGQDMSQATQLVTSGKLSKPLLDRLKLTEDKISGMAKGVDSVAKLPDPVGRTLSAVELDEGLELRQVSCPIGVIGAIFESRPDAVPQIASLCWKAGNAVILKGGTEAQESNRALVGLMRQAVAAIDQELPDAVQMIETREDVRALLGLEDHVDLFVPRGSNEFVRYIQDNTRVPVLGHADGICHAYVDEYADIEQAVSVCYDAKVQYPAVCNAIETVLVHRRIAPAFLPLLAKAFERAGVDMRGCDGTRTLLPDVKPATAEDWDTEYLDLVVSIRLVDNVEEAIAHVNCHGSGHTDTIITEDRLAAERFLSGVDAATVMHNASTRFADGFRFGKGAEIGISTNKTHARGPVGLEGLVLYKYRLTGRGHVVADYVGPQAKPFTHRQLPRE
jgi:glutamate-5-semialdehyde dehydrogenase